MLKDKMGFSIRIKRGIFFNFFFIFLFGTLVSIASTALAQHEKSPSREEMEHAIIKKRVHDASKAAAQVKALNGPFKGQRKAGGPLTAADNDVINEMKQHARDRSKAMEGLIASDPGLALQIALTPEERDQFPEPVRAELETEVNMEGELEVLVEDNFEEGTAKTHHAITVGNERYSLHFVEQPPELMSGSKVKVKGLRAGKRVAVPHQ